MTAFSLVAQMLYKQADPAAKLTMQQAELLAPLIRNAIELAETTTLERAAGIAEGFTIGQPAQPFIVCADTADAIATRIRQLIDE